MIAAALFLVGLSMWASPILVAALDGVNVLNDAAYYKWVADLSLERIAMLEQAVLVGPLLTIAGVALPR